MSVSTVIDVVIVNYNSGAALLKCLETIYEGNRGHINTTVVDNASSDGSLNNIPKQHNINVINNSSNVGFSKACNQGAESGQCDYIAFINPDCFITQKQLLTLSETLRTDEHAVLVGCRVLNEDGTLQAASRRRCPTFWRIAFHMSRLSRIPLFKGINIKDDGNLKQVLRVEAVNGACMMIKRPAFNQVQGFDEGFPLHFEDLDLFARLQKQIGDILYQPNVQVVHLKGHSKQSSEQIIGWKKQGLLRFMKKHRPRWESVLVKFLIAVK